MSKSQQVSAARAWIANWGFAVVWAAQPLVAGPAVADALSPRSTLFRTAAGVAAWAIWAAVLVAALVPRTTSLTLIRIVAPASVVVAVWAAVATSSPGGLDALALASTTVAAVVALMPVTAERFVNGSAYGPERRFPLRSPAIVVFGLGEMVWAVVVAGAAAGPLLLAAGRWPAGVALVVVGWPVAALGTRSLHRLAQRWLVFVPAGITLVDPLVLADSLAMPRGTIASMGAAPADTAAEDLTAGAAGLAVEVVFTAPQTLSPLTRSTSSVTEHTVAGVLFTPTRPGALLREGRARGVRVS